MKILPNISLDKVLQTEHFFGNQSRKILLPKVQIHLSHCT